MRTNIVIDDELMQKALDVSGLKTKKEVIQKSLEMLIKVNEQSRLRAFRGKLKWEGDLDLLRTDT